MSITLHRATDEMRALLDQIDPETGEMPEGFDSARELVERKAIGCIAYLLEEERQLESVKAYIKDLTAKVKSQERRNDYLRGYLRHHMTEAGITEIKDERGIFKASLAVGRDESVEVYDEAQIPQDYLQEIPAKYKVDKTLIKKAIKDGFTVPGARIARKDRLTIR